MPCFVVVVVVEGRRGRLGLQSWEGCLDAPPNPPSLGEGGGGAVVAYGKSSGILGYKKLFSSVRRLRVLIEKILPDLQIFYGFGLKQVP